MVSRRLIVFLLPAEKIVNGGILSIFSICKVSREFESIHKSEVRLSVLPGNPSYRKMDLFDNNEVINSFDEIVNLGTPQSLMLHIPEYASWNVYWALKEYADYLEAIPELSINIMTQNILLLQPPHEVAKWFTLTPHVSQTTAHNRYCRQELADKYFLPTHHLSTFVDSDQYKWTDFEKKDDLIVVSPDLTDKRAEIIEKVTKAFPTYEIVTIQNMKYESYKDIMSRAKFTITFGEGFDGYYVESFFSGGIAYAVYNEEFFPDKDYNKFENTYQSYEKMSDHIVEDMKRHNSKKTYEKISQENLKKIKSLYSFDKYKENLKKFYQKKYTFLPSLEGGWRLIGTIERKDEKLFDIKTDELAKHAETIRDQSELLEKHKTTIATTQRELGELINSRSWKVTRPLRAASSIRKKQIRH